jgi:predicted metal-binding transcription factor (methanogenesis marker protein 9)
MLKKVKLPEKKYIQIKDLFTEKVGWSDTRPCFKSLAYCCLRRNGCSGGRDAALADLYRDKVGTFEGVMREYFLRKRVLAVILLKEAENKKLVEPYIELELKSLHKTGRIELLELLSILG